MIELQRHVLSQTMQLWIERLCVKVSHVREFAVMRYCSVTGLDWVSYMEQKHYALQFEFDT